MKNPFVQLAQEGLVFLKRPIYVTLLYYGIALVLWGIIGDVPSVVKTLRSFLLLG